MEAPKTKTPEQLTDAERLQVWLLVISMWPLLFGAGCMLVFFIGGLVMLDVGLIVMSALIFCLALTLNSRAGQKMVEIYSIPPSDEQDSTPPTSTDKTPVA